MKKQFIAALAMAAAVSANAANMGTIAVQDGYALKLEWTADGISTAGNDNRSGVGVNDKFYVNYYGQGVKVYSNTGELLKTIPPTEGYHNWVSCNVDQAGHVLVQLDVKVFDGTISTNGGHGFMVIDSATDEVIVPFLPMTSSAWRYDAMSPVQGNILETDKVGIYSVCSNAPTNSAVSTFRYLYNKVGAEKPSWWQAVPFTTGTDIVPADGAPSLFSERGQKQTSTGYAMQYTLQGDENFSIFVEANTEYKTTYSAEGCYGNAIRKYTAGYKPVDGWVYTPQHSGLSAFNFFNLDGKDYVIYPAGKMNEASEAFAITEVTYVDSPATDMAMEGETLVDGKLAGPLKARLFAALNEAGTNALYPGNTNAVGSFNVVPVEGDPKSVYIYVYANGAPGAKYKFSVGVEPAPELPGTGEGTLDSPYDVARVLGLIDAELNDENAEVYVTGVIKSISEVSTYYGNATYSIKDADADNSFGIYRGLYLDQAKFTAENQIAVNDTVVVCGKAVNYKGNTPQLTADNYLVSIKKAPVVEPPVEPGTDFSDCTGTEEATIAAADFSVLKDNKENSVIVKFTGEGKPGYGFDFEKAGNSSSRPAYNANADAVRLYAGNTMTVYGGKLTNIEFVLDQKNQGKRYCPVTASTGEIATQAVGDTCIVWTGDATEVTFTVGEKATLGSESGSPGQIHFIELVINAATEEEPEPEPAVTATLGSVATQEGYILEALWTADEISEFTPSNLPATNRSGVGVNDKFYVNYYGEGTRVYSNTGKLLKTIPATEGYHNWVSCNVDQEGYVYVQIDKKAFDGSCSTNGDHGFMVIDSKTDEVVVPFLPMTFGYAARFDAMSPIQGSVFDTEKLGIWSVVNAGTSTYRFLYNNVGAEKPSYWTTKTCTTGAQVVEDTECKSALTNEVVKYPSLFPKDAAKQTSTGYAMQYTLQGDENFSIFAYANPVYNVTYSAAGMYGNGIHKFTAGYANTEDWVYTPQHSGLTAFNFFNIGGKDYVIYPAGLTNVSADAFAIAEVTYVDSPATDMDMVGETLVEGKPVGALKARVFAALNEAGTTALYAGNTSTVPSYNVVPVDGDEKSVYIYVYSNGAPGVKYKFTADPQDGIADLIGAEGEGEAVYYNLQGIRVANPANGIYIMRQGNKVSKVIR